MLVGVESQERLRPAARGLRVALARTAADVEAAQRLRYRVFVDELGARVSPRRPGIDEDIFDPYCEHLVVRDEATDEVVGTYRVLDPARARRVGLYYAETEFDLTRLQLLRAGIGEIGRACIHPDYRTGGAITRLWQGLATLATERGFRHLIGCASMSMSDGGAAAARVAAHLVSSHLAPIEYRVFPRHPLAAQHDGPAGADADAAVPPLLRAYLRLGAWIGGDPAWDPDFNVADFFVFLPLDRLAQRYARHYLKAA